MTAPQFTLAEAVRGTEPLAPPAIPEGYRAVPYQRDGWRSGIYWAPVPKAMPLKTASRYFNDPLADLRALGWREFFDPDEPHYDPDWELQRLKMQLMRMVGMQPRWFVSTRDERTFRYVAAALRAEGFNVDHFHVGFRDLGQRYWINLSVRQDGSVWSREGAFSNSLITRYDRLTADERHPRHSQAPDEAK